MNPADIKAHEDLLDLPVISGKTIRENQPPETAEFVFRSAGWEDILTIHETSETSGTPKSFFFTWEDWERYAENMPVFSGLRVSVPRIGLLSIPLMG